MKVYARPINGGATQIFEVDTQDVAQAMSMVDCELSGLSTDVRIFALVPKHSNIAEILDREAAELAAARGRIGGGSGDITGIPPFWDWATPVEIPGSLLGAALYNDLSPSPEFKHPAPVIISPLDGEPIQPRPGV